MAALAQRSSHPTEQGSHFHLGMRLRPGADNPRVLQILDVATGKLTPVPYRGVIDEVAQLSWSPDGKYLVGQFCCSASSAAQIVVVDLRSGKGTVIAEGMDPSWSPKGDLIAYEDKEKQKCILIHPDGTGAKVVRDLTKGFGFGHWIIFQRCRMVTGWSENDF
jgi:WD40 repeat protein